MELVSNFEQQVEALSSALSSEKARFARWLVACCCFAILVSALAILTKSVFFLAAGGFGCFFVWNRWKCWSLLRSLLSTRPPSDSDEQERWLSTVASRLQNSPTWFRFSEYASAVTLMILFAIISVMVVATTRYTWMRVLYGTGWLIIITAIVVSIRSALRKTNQHVS